MLPCSKGRSAPMRDFTCPNYLAFENSLCLSCGSALGFSLDEGALLVIAHGEDSEHGGAVDAGQYRLCGNLYAAECNWRVKRERGPREDELCTSCRLTRTRPNDADTEAMAAFAAAEKAKRRLIAELDELRLPIVGRDEDPQYGLAFDLLSSSYDTVVTGHKDGVITSDLAEGDALHREQLRIAMDEPYRTLFGHFRHEIGHSYFATGSSGHRMSFLSQPLGGRGLFGWFVSGGVVRGLCAPTGPNDAQSGATNCAQGVWVALTPGAGSGVALLGPGAGAAAVVEPGVQCLACAAVGGVSELHGVSFARGAGDWSDAGFGGELVKARTQSRCDATAPPWFLRHAALRPCARSVSR